MTLSIENQKLKSQVESLKSKLDKACEALEMCANTLEVSVTFMDFHGRPSVPLNNCKNHIKTYAERTREA